MGGQHTAIGRTLSQRHPPSSQTAQCASSKRHQGSRDSRADCPPGQLQVLTLTELPHPLKDVPIDSEQSLQEMALRRGRSLNEGWADALAVLGASALALRCAGGGGELCLRNGFQA